MLQHPWFQDLDIEALENCELEAPILPSSSGMNEQYFNIKQKGEDLKMSRIPKQNVKLIQKHANQF